MKRFRNIIIASLASAALLLSSAPEVQAQSRRNERGHENTSQRSDNGGSYRRSKGGEGAARSSAGNRRGDNNRADRPGSAKGQRPGGNGNHAAPGNNAAQGNHGNNHQHQQSNNHQHQQSNRPNNNNDRLPGNNTRPAPAPQYRPGAASQNRPAQGMPPANNPGNNHNRPQQAPGYYPGNGHIHQPGRPGTVRPGMNMHRPPVAPPPPRPYHPVNWHYTGRPLPPPSWRPPSRPRLFFSSVLGIAFGTAINVSLDYLFNSGYTVDGYNNNTVYLNDVRQLGFLWPYASLFYDVNGYLSASEFVFSTPGYDLGRYNSAYSALVRAYGPPVSVSNSRNDMSASWWGSDNQFITLRFSYGAPQSGPARYFTTLTFGL